MDETDFQSTKLTRLNFGNLAIVPAYVHVKQFIGTWIKVCKFLWQCHQQIQNSSVLVHLGMDNIGI